MGTLDGQVAVITGAAGGQGEAEAVLFAEEGARVVLCDVLDDLGQAVADRLGRDVAHYVHLDVSREPDWATGTAQALDAFGGIDILINNAGIPGQSPLEGTPGVLAARGGCQPDRGLPRHEGRCPADARTRRGETAALELAPSRILVNLLLPGLTDTPVLGDVPPEVSAVLAEQSPLHQQGRPRIGQASDVAAAALYLCSPASVFISGAELAVDGAHGAG